MAYINLILLLILLGSSVEAQNSLNPPSSLPTNFVSKFGCGLAADSSRLAIYAPTSPLQDSLDNWRTLSYLTKPTPDGWEFESNFSTPSVTGSGFIGDSEPCVIDTRNGFIAVGEPWAHTNRGRVILRPKVSTPGKYEAPFVVAEGRNHLDRFGQSLALTDKWLVVGAPGADEVVIYELTSSGFVEHTRLENEDFGGLSLESLSIGESVNIADGWLVIGAPATPGHAVRGVVLVFIYTDAEDAWTLYQVIQSTSNAYSSTFGTIVRNGNDHIYISSPGSSTDSGTVSVYQRVSHREFSMIAVLQGKERGDEFGRAIAGSPAALAVSQATTSANRIPTVHVYLKCGSSHVNAIHTVLKPADDLTQFDSRWGSALAWSSNSLFITSRGRLDVWTLPSLKHTSCGGSFGIFPTPECCYNGTNVVVSHSSTGLILPSTSSTPSPSSTPTSTNIYITTPIRIYERVTFLPTAILSIEPSATIFIDGPVRFAGKLKLRMPRPTQSTSIHIDRMISYTTHEGTFQEVEIVFTSTGSSCDKLKVLPVYGDEALSLVISFTTSATCSSPKSSNSLLPVYLALAVLLAVIITIAALIWRCPQLREMISARPVRPGFSEYRHTRLASSETEANDAPVNELSDAYANYPEDGYDFDPEIEDDGEDSDPELDFH